MTSHKKHPRDANQLANSIVDIATGADEGQQTLPIPEKNPAAELGIPVLGLCPSQGVANAFKLVVEHG
jgi:hypothetical protein